MDGSSPVNVLIAGGGVASLETADGESRELRRSGALASPSWPSTAAECAELDFE
jgi:hypothetical protein